MTATPPGSSGSSTTSPGQGTTSKPTCEYRGEAINCDPPEPGQWWSNERQCWISVADPQPSKDASVWQGNTEGAIYMCSPPSFSGGRLGTSFGAPTFFWADITPPAAAVSPAALAREAVERMNLVSPTVGATPLPGRDAVSLVGMPTWLWVEDADDRSWGPITRTASAGGVTVTATARVSTVIWDMGDGTTVTCSGKGTRWTPVKGTGDSPTCGYRYLKPSTSQRDGVFTITATAQWVVDWQGAGQSGRITFPLSGSRDLTVTELQVLQTS